MGTLVAFRSTALLLQREDFPGALRALHKIAKTVPSFFRDSPGVLALRDLPAALEKGEFRPSLDAYGDIVGLTYIGDKWPPDGPDTFPEHLVFGLAKFLRGARFRLEVEGVSGTRRYWVDRGKVTSQMDPYRPRRLEAIGPAPSCMAGESVRVPFRLVSDLDDDATEVGIVPGTDAALQVTVSSATLRVGDEAYAEVRPSANGPHRPGAIVSFLLYGRATPSANAWLELRTLVPTYDADASHGLVARESTGWPSGRGSFYVNKKHSVAALESMRRYAARHRDEPGGAFLHGVHAAPDLESAWREAGLVATVDGAGHVRSLAVEGVSLRGGERHLEGLLASYASLTDAYGQIHLVYEATPEWRTSFLFHRGSCEVRRERVTALLEHQSG